MLQAESTLLPKETRRCMPSATRSTANDGDKYLPRDGLSKVFVAFDASACSDWPHATFLRLDHLQNGGLT